MSGDDRKPRVEKPLNQKLLRRSRNAQLIQRMKRGESLHQFNSELSWFPPRPIISKDPEAMKRLYTPAQPNNKEKLAVLHPLDADAGSDNPHDEAS